MVAWVQVLKEIKVFEGPNGSWMPAVAISADCSKIVFGRRDGTVCVWSLESGQVPACLLCRKCCVCLCWTFVRSFTFYKR